MMTPRDFRTGYLDDGLFRLDDVIARAIDELAPIPGCGTPQVDFDTIVGTGFSGAVVIPSLARALGKHYVLVRKNNDDSHHGSGKLMGRLGKRWLFIDDFVGTGRTRQRVRDKITDGAYPYVTEYVGSYLYVNAAHGGYGFQPVVAS